MLWEFLRGFLFGDYRYPKNYLPAGFARIAIMYLIVLGWVSVAIQNIEIIDGYKDFVTPHESILTFDQAYLENFTYV